MFDNLWHDVRRIVEAGTGRGPRPSGSGRRFVEFVRHFGFTALVGLVGVVGGCRSEQGAPARKPVVIFAAASTKEPVGALAAEFRDRTGAEVAVSLGSSSQLARQIDQGAAVDLFLSADVSTVDFLAVRQKIHSRRNLLTNRLVVAAPADSTFELKTLADLADPRFAKIAIAEPKVPAGEYARQALAKVGVLEKVRGRFVGGVDVRATLQFVARGECEAAFVYATDVGAAGEATRVAGVRVLLTVPEELHEPIVYPLAIVLGGEADSFDVSRFHDHLRSQHAADVFRRHGFGMAPADADAPGRSER